MNKNLTHYGAVDAFASGTQRLRDLFDHLPLMAVALTDEGVIIDVNRPLLFAANLSPRDVIGRKFVDCFWWRDNEAEKARIAECCRRCLNGETVRLNTEIDSGGDGRATLAGTFAPLPRNNGGGNEIIWTASKVEPLIDVKKDLPDATAQGFNGVDDKDRLQLALDAADLGVWDWDMVTGQIEWSDRIYLMAGYDVGEIEPSFSAFCYRVHPSDLPRLETAMDAARNDPSTFECAFRVVQRGGSPKHVVLRGNYLFDSAGEPYRMIAVLQDVSQLKESREHRQILELELNHRIKNTLATIQAMASHTMRGTDSMQQFREEFSARLQAVSATHEVLFSSVHQRAAVRDLICRHLAPFADVEGSGVQLSGGNLDLGPKSAHAIAVVLHELAANAKKHGALQQANGVIAVDWATSSHDGRNGVQITWRESGGADVAKPSRRGFGIKITEQIVRNTLDGQVAMEFRPEGLEVRIWLPVEA